MLRSALWVAVAIGACALSAEASLTVYDGFNYPASSNLTGKNGGFGFSQPWASGAGTITDGSLTSGPLSVRGNAVFAQAPGETLNRTLSTPLGTPGTTAYISFLVQPIGAPDPNLSYGLGLLGSVDNLFIGKASFPPGNSQYVLERFHGPGQVSSGVNAIANTTVFLVVRADFTAGNDTFRLYVNPPAGGTEPASPNALKNDFDFGTISAVQINGTGNFDFDELRIATTYANAVAQYRPGDANGDGSVDFTDLVTVAQHYNTFGGQTLETGDFTGDGNVLFNDLTILAQNYGTGPTSAADLQAAMARVPEPSAVSLLVAGAIGCGIRRRHRA